MGEEIEKAAAEQPVVKMRKVRDNSAAQVMQRTLAMLSLILFLAALAIPDRNVGFFLGLLGLAATAVSVFAFVKPRAFFALSIVSLVLNVALVAYAIASFYGYVLI